MKPCSHKNILATRYLFPQQKKRNPTRWGFATYNPRCLDCGKSFGFFNKRNFNACFPSVPVVEAS